jgi:hypothetical protein
LQHQVEARERAGLRLTLGARDSGLGSGSENESENAVQRRHEAKYGACRFQELVREPPEGAGVQRE